MKNEKFQNERLQFIRANLDKLNFIQSFDVYSLDLVECLYNDIVKKQREINSINKEYKKISTENEERKLIINALKYKITAILKENEDLHKEIIELMNSKSLTEESDTLIKKSKEENESMKFLISEYKAKINELNKENLFLKSKQEKFITNLYEKSINIKQIIESNNNIDSRESFEKNLNDLISSKKEHFELSEPLSPSDIGNIQFNNSVIQENINRSIKIKNEHNYKAINTLQVKLDQSAREIKEKENEIAILKNQINQFFNFKSTSTSNQFSTQNEESYDNLRMIIDFLKTEMRTQKEKYESYIKYLLDNQKNHYDTLNEYKIGKNEIVQKLQDENIMLKKRLKHSVNLYNELNTKNISLIAELNTQKKQSMKTLQTYPVNTSFVICSNNFDLISKAQSKHKNLVLSQNEKIIQQETKNKVNEKEIKALNQKLNAYDNENKELKLHLTEIENAYSKLQDEYNNKMRNKLSSELNGNELESQLSMLKNEKETLESTISSLNTELFGHEKKLSLLYEEIVSKNNEIQRLNNLNTMLETQIKIFNTN